MRRAALLALLPACYSRLWRDPPYFPPEPQHVPLSIEWQWPVEVYSGGSPAPMPVTDAAASCIPADACTVFFDVPRDPRFADPPRLSVIGTHLGPAKVAISYMHPKRQTKMTAQVDFVFEPAEQLHVLAVGDAEPTTPFIYTYGSDQLRCEAWVKPEYNCFVRERDRFTCAGSGCGDSALRRLTLVLEIDAGHVKSTELHDQYSRDALLQHTP